MDEQLLELKEKDIKKTSRSKQKGKTTKEKSLLLLELAEIKDISDKLFERIEKKIEVLKALESSVDEKIVALKKLGQDAVSIEKPSAGIDHKLEVLSLKKKGLGIQEISGILGIPIGEVELILNLHKDQTVSDEALKTQQAKRILSKDPLVYRNSRKILSRKLLWTSAFLVVGLIIFYIVFLQRNNNIPSSPQIAAPHPVEQVKNVPHVETPVVEKSKALDLIRQQYIVPNAQTDKQISPPVQQVPLQIKTPVVKEKKPADLKKTVTVITPSATIRSKPSLDSEPVTWVLKGIVFEIKEEFTDEAGKRWYKVVTTEGKKGWLADKVVKEPS